MSIQGTSQGLSLLDGRLAVAQGYSLAGIERAKPMPLFGPTGVEYLKPRRDANRLLKAIPNTWKPEKSER